MKTGQCTAIIAAILMLVGFETAAQELDFAPIDEGAKDAQWQAYKGRLLDALEKKNRQALIAAIDPNVDNGPEIKAGVAEFRRRWDLDLDKSPIWEELRKAVGLGGAYIRTPKGQRRFCAPYVASKWPSSLDPFLHGAITAREVLVKSEPSSSAATVATLTYAVVKVDDWEVADKAAGWPQKWTKIKLRDRSGFIPEEHIRSPIEHMACFSAEGGAWRLTSFTAGYIP